MIKLLYVLVALAAVGAGYFMSTQQFSPSVPPTAPKANLPKAVVSAPTAPKPIVSKETIPKATVSSAAAPMTTAPATTHSSDLIGTYRPDFKLGSQSGEFVTADDFAGKTVLFNFWATWCAPCREEMPMLVELQSQYGDQGLQVVGIALDDVQKVRDFVQAFGISYPVLVGATDVMQTNQNYGNLSGALPYSVLVDADGIIRWQYSGALQRDELVGILQQWL